MTAIWNGSVRAPPQQPLAIYATEPASAGVERTARLLGGISRSLQASSNPVDCAGMIQRLVGSPGPVFPGTAAPTAFTPIQVLPNRETSNCANSPRRTQGDRLLPPDLITMGLQFVKLAAHIASRQAVASSGKYL